METCTYGLGEGNRKSTAVMPQGADYLSYKEAGFQVGYNLPYNVEYRGNVVGEYFADLVVNNMVILELKSVKQLGEAHKAQLINYLHISGCRVGYLLNFQGAYLEFQRMVV